MHMRLEHNVRTQGAVRPAPFEPGIAIQDGAEGLIAPTLCTQAAWLPFSVLSQPAVAAFLQDAILGVASTRL